MPNWSVLKLTAQKDLAGHDDDLITQQLAI